MIDGKKNQQSNRIWQRSSAGESPDKCSSRDHFKSSFDKRNVWWFFNADAELQVNAAAFVSLLWITPGVT